MKGQDWSSKIIVTALNDEYHKNSKSAHALGKAIDFSLAGYGPPTKEEWEKNKGKKNPIPEHDKPMHEKIKAFVQSMNGKFIDEYYEPSAGATGGHFHVEFARRGLMPGMVNAPDSGRLVEVHGREMIAPLDPNSIIAQLLTASPDQANSIMNSMNNTEVSEELRAGFSGMIDRMESLISKINVLNSTQEEMLVYNRG